MNNTSRLSTTSTVFIHSLIFLFPFLLLITSFGVGLCSFVFLLTAIIFYRKGWAALRPQLAEVRPTLLAFGVVWLIAALGVAFNSEVRLREMEKPIRMLATAGVMLTVLACRPNRKTLWWGLIAGIMAGFAFIAYQRWHLGIERPGGLINPITFGDMMLCMGLMCLAATLDFSGRNVLWPALGALVGLAGSIITGTRGGWLAIALSAVLLVQYGHVLQGRWRKGLALLVLLLLVGSYFVPAAGTRARVDQGLTDVHEYFNGGPTDTSMGIRFELWRTATQLIEQHPLAGASVPRIQAEMQALVNAGKAPAYVMDYSHFHNQILQTLVYGGVIGLLAWAATLLAPFLFFRRQLRLGASPAPALAGMLLVLSYFSFGLTEVIMWSVHSSMFYAMMLFLLAGLCLDSRAPGNTAPAEAA